MTNRLCDEYLDGFSVFIEVAKNYANSLGHISCPCIKCRNQDMLPIEIVRGQIHRFGFDTIYTKWIHHGKADVISSTESGVAESIDEMFAILNDVAGLMMNLICWMR